MSIITDPEHKVYTDPRLEVAGADLFQRYTTISKSGSSNESARLGSRARPDRPPRHPGRPRIQFGHRRHAACECALAVCLVRRHRRRLRPRFVRGRGQAEPVDFAARHFRPDQRAEPTNHPESDRSCQGISQLRPGARTSSERSRSPACVARPGQRPAHPGESPGLIRWLEDPGPNRAES